jgi:ATP-dependent DNA helicase RecQ
MNAKQILRQYFGYDEFRPLQSEIISHVLEGKDALVLMPTGGGKSMCFQIPALLFEGLTVVISPLIALMKDQVEALRSNGIKASYINSSLPTAEQEAVLWAVKMGELKLLYIAPEKLFSGSILSFLKDVKVSLFAIDEAHCISSWGHDFRPEYRQLSKIRSEFENVPFLALTATADHVTRKDICTQMGINPEHSFISSFDRPNLSLKVLMGQQRTKQIHSFLNTQKNQSGIIYCLSRRGTESLADDLRKLGFKAEAYHAGMTSEQRNRVQTNFINDDTPIIVATIAFGMGIDKSNVRWVIHYNLPSNVESFYQEIGRAGRDGANAETILFYSYADIVQRRRMIFDSDSPYEQKELMEAKLERMKQYAEANICRRRILISYFNEGFDKDCGNCDVCKNPRRQFDATILAQKALSAISRTQEKIALTMLIDILRGSRNQSVLRYGYEKLPTFGVGNDVRGEVWTDYILQFLNSGVMNIAYDEGHTFKLNETSRQILKGNRKVIISEYISIAERQKEQEQKPKTKAQGIRNELFDELKVLRKQIADSLALPAYIVFSDATLEDMSTKMPLSKAEFMLISGVGQEKYTKFGDIFIDKILDFVKKTASQKPSLLKSKTQDLTLALYMEGKTVEEIASFRNFSKSTILGHLVKLSEEGHDINLKALIDTWDLNSIGDALPSIGYKKGEPLKPIFEHFEGNLDYGTIRLALFLLDMA